jgi:thymidine kinase
MGTNVLYINNSLDDRSDSDISTHNPLINKEYNFENIKTIKTDNLYKIDNNFLNDFMVIAIDEAQFFIGLKNFVLDLVEKKGKRVIVAGLNGDFNREIFGEITSLISYCDRITKLSSFCKTCASNKKIKDAHFSHRINKNKEKICIGSSDQYIPLCRECYINYE